MAGNPMDLVLGFAYYQLQEFAVHMAKMNRSKLGRASRARWVYLFPALVLSQACLDPDGPWPLPDTGGVTSSAGSDSGGATSTGDASGGPALVVSLRADSNRDGRVDLDGVSDLEDKNAAGPYKGALFLANIDDDGQRCKAGASKASQTCFDASDEEVNGEADAKDLAVLKSVPMQVSDAALGRVTLGAGQETYVRLFVKDVAGNFRVHKASDTFSASQLRAGLEVFVEGKDIVRDLKVWDGSIRVRLQVEDGMSRGSDEVTLQVAPILTHSHVDPVERLIAAPIESPMLNAFRSGIEGALSKIGMPSAPVYLRSDPHDEWAQDFFEPFYASVPGPKGPSTMRVLLRSDQDRESAQLDLYTLAGPDVAVAAIRLVENPGELVKAERGSTYNSFGNLETIPPYPGYPAGRQILGDDPGPSAGASAHTLALLSAQRVQDPIQIDTSWLAVAHVDEFLSFVPHPQAKLGFKILVADPVGTLELLKQAVAKGHGETPLISYRPTTEAEKKVLSDLDEKVPTLASLVNSALVEKRQVYAQGKIEEAITKLKGELGISDEDIVKIPSLLTQDDGLGGSDIGDLGEMVGAVGKLRMRTVSGMQGTSQLLAALSPEQRQRLTSGIAQRSADDDGAWPPTLGAHLPAAMNMVVFPERKAILLAKQFGPVIEGVDIVERAVSQALEGLGYTPYYIDDYLTYHMRGGEVHCATNTLRKPRTDWWTK